MQADLGFSPENLSWVFNAYVVAFGGLLLLGGRLSDLLGARRMFTAGWAVLLAGSLVAGLADASAVELAAPRRPGRRRRAHRAVRADPADDALRRRAQGADQGASPCTARPRRPAAPPACSSAASSPSTSAGPGCSTSTSRSPCSRSPPPRALMPAGAGPARLHRPRRRAHRDRRPRRRRVRASCAPPRSAGAPRRRWLRPGRRGRAARRVRRDPGRAAREPLMRLSHLPRPEPRRREPRPAPARRGLDPDVVLPQPLPAAGPRLQRVPQRRGAAADDRPDHDRDDRPRPAAIGRFGPKADGRRPASACWPPAWAGSSLVRPDGSFSVDVLPASLVAALGMSLAFIPSLGTASPAPGPRKAAWPPASSTPATRSARHSAWPP